MRTGRCSFWDLAHASAIQSASSPSATVHGDGCFPATTSRNVSNSARNAGWKRSMKNRCDCPDGNSTPGCSARIGQPSSTPAATLSFEPCTSSRTS